MADVGRGAMRAATKDLPLRIWLIWLSIEYRALAVLLPVICLELAIACALAAHLPLYFGLPGALPALLAPDVWRLSAQIVPAGHSV